MNRASGICRTVAEELIFLSLGLRERVKSVGLKKIFEEIIVPRNFSNLSKDINLQLKGAE